METAGKDEVKPEEISHEDPHSTEDDMQISACLGLSELSCSTANNDGFFVVPSSEDESSSTNAEKCRKDRAGGGDSILVRSVAAQTSSLDESPRKILLDAFSFPNPCVHNVKEVRRASGAHSTFTGNCHSFSAVSPKNCLMSATPSKKVLHLAAAIPPFPSFVSSRNESSLSNNDVSNVDSYNRRETSPSCYSPRGALHHFAQSGTVDGGAAYPMLYVGGAGTISIVISCDLVVEIAVDRSIRVVSHEHFAATISGRGTSSAILHTRARILHQGDNLWAKFSSSNDKMTAFSPLGVFFTMSHLHEGYLVNSGSVKSPVAVPLDAQQFNNMDQDFTVRMFYNEGHSGQQLISMCKDIVHQATYERVLDGALHMNVHGVQIRHAPSGELHIDARPRQITCNPLDCSIHLRSPHIDMAVQANEKAYVKRGMKRVHVSRSGMVVSDGNCITSMDHFGRIVCCT